MESELAEAWRTSQAMNLLLLDAVPEEALGDRYAARTRTVAAQFAHLHNNRVSHLKNLASDRLGDLQGFARGAQPSKAELRAALEASARTMAGFFEHCEKEGKVKGWRGSPTTYLSYHVAHEAHHRGLALVALRLSGTKMPKEVTYGIWYWRKRRDEKPVQP